MANRDLKHSSRPATVRPRASSRRGNGIWIGLLLGVIIGVASLGGVVWYINRLTYQSAKPKGLTSASAPADAPLELLLPGTRIASGKQSSSETTVSTTDKSSRGPTEGTDKNAPLVEEEQRFGFYKILPGDSTVLPGGMAAKTQQELANTPPSERLYLQLGAFQNQDEADNIKAKLALLGVEATIQSIDLPGKGLLHRVRVGPFTYQESIDNMRTKLKAEGIEATVVTMNN